MSLQQLYLEVKRTSLVLVGVRQGTTGVKILHDELTQYSRYSIFHCLVVGSAGLIHITFVVALLEVVGTEHGTEAQKWQE